MISTVRGLECKLMTFLASLIYGNSYSSWTLSSMDIICGGRFCVVHHFGRSLAIVGCGRCGVWKACLRGLWEAFLCGHETRVCVRFRSKLCVVTWEVCMSAVCGVGYYIGNEHSSPERGGLDPSSPRGQILPPTVWTRCSTTVRETCHRG